MATTKRKLGLTLTLPSTVSTKGLATANITVNAGVLNCAALFDQDRLNACSAFGIKLSPGIHDSDISMKARVYGSNGNVIDKQVFNIDCERAPTPEKCSVFLLPPEQVTAMNTVLTGLSQPTLIMEDWVKPRKAGTFNVMEDGAGGHASWGSYQLGQGGDGFIDGSDGIYGSPEVSVYNPFFISSKTNMGIGSKIVISVKGKLTGSSLQVTAVGAGANVDAANEANNSLNEGTNNYLIMQGGDLFSMDLGGHGTVEIVFPFYVGESHNS